MSQLYKDKLNVYIEKHNMDIISKPDKINRDTRIHYYCIKDGCFNTYNKTVRNIIDLGGAYCKQCTNNNKAAKTKQTALKKYGVTNHANQPEILRKKNEAKKQRDLEKINNKLEKEQFDFDILLKKFVICAKICKISPLRMVSIILLFTKAYYSSYNKFKLGKSIEMFDKDRHIMFLKPLKLSSASKFKHHFLLKNLRKCAVSCHMCIAARFSPNSACNDHFPGQTGLSRKTYLPLKAEAECSKWCNINELLSNSKLSSHQKAKLICSYNDFKDFCKNIIVSWIKINNLELYNQVYGNKTRKGGNNLWSTWKTYNDIPSHIPGDPPDKYKEEWMINKGWNGVFDTPKPCIDAEYITKNEKSQKRLELMLSQHSDINHNKNEYCCAGIYLYTFPDGKQYVGQTCKTILIRTDEHIYEAYKNDKRGGCTKLNHKIRQLCGTNVTSTLDEFTDKFYKYTKLEVLYTGYTLLDEKETEFMNKYNTRNGSHGLNLRPGNSSNVGSLNHNSIEMPRGIYKVDKDGHEGYYTSIFGKDATENSKIFTWKELTMNQKYEYAMRLKEFSQEKCRNGKIRSQLYTSKEIIYDFCKNHNIPVGSNRPAQFGHNNQFLPDNVYYTNKGYSIKTSINRGRDIIMYRTTLDKYKTLEKQKDLVIEILAWISKSDFSLSEIDTRPKLRAVLQKLYPTHHTGSSRLPLVDLIVQLMELEDHKY